MAWPHTGDRSSAQPGLPTRLRWVGILLPVVFLIALQVLRVTVFERWWPGRSFLIAGAIGVAGAAVFGFVIFLVIERVHRVIAEQNQRLRRDRRESDEVARLLWLIAEREPVPEVLNAVGNAACDLLGAEVAGICLDPWVAGEIEFPPERMCGSPYGPVCVTVSPVQQAEPLASCPLHDTQEDPRLRAASLRSGERRFGRLWVLLPGGAPHDRERQQLATLADLAVVALSHARMNETERTAAALAERERIAREMHDSIAQVLGVAHLRLRSLEASPDLTDRVRSDVNDLADVCHEAYRDVREAILGLRESSLRDRSLVESLETYVATFSRQSGIPTRVEVADDAEIRLTPQGEIQVIRVIQEALTNVRKHSGARRAVVRVRADGTQARFVIQDDGHGFDPEISHRRDGFGLHMMRERAELAKGRLYLYTAPGRGTQVVVTLPRIVPGAGRASQSGEHDLTGTPR